MLENDENNSLITTDGEDDNASLISLDLTSESVEGRRPIIWIDSDCLSSDESRYFTPPSTPTRVRPRYVGLRERENIDVPNNRFWLEFCSRQERIKNALAIMVVLVSAFLAWLHCCY